MVLGWQRSCCGTMLMALAGSPPQVRQGRLFMSSFSGGSLLYNCLNLDAKGSWRPLGIDGHNVLQEPSPLDKLREEQEPCAGGSHVCLRNLPSEYIRTRKRSSFLFSIGFNISLVPSTDTVSLSVVKIFVFKKPLSFLTEWVKRTNLELRSNK